MWDRKGYDHICNKVEWKMSRVRNKETVPRVEGRVGERLS